MVSLRSTLFATCCIALHTSFPAAATIATDGDQPRERIIVTIQDMGLGAALREIGLTYGFEIKGTLADSDQAVSTTVSGNLQDVLARLLRNVNHVIVRSQDNRSGIERVIIMGGGRAPQPSASQGAPENGGSPPPEQPSSSTNDERD
jgi:hypothetical protein